MLRYKSWLRTQEEDEPLTDKGDGVREEVDFVEQHSAGQSESQIHPALIGVEVVGPGGTLCRGQGSSY